MSGWLFLLHQTVCAWSLLFSVGLCAGLRRISPLRLSAASLLCGAGTLLCPHPLWRLFALGVITLLAPRAAWPGVPRGLRGQLSLTALALSLLMAGSARLVHSLGMSRTPLVLALIVALPAFTRLVPARTQGRCVTVEIVCGAHRLELTALIDSGNLLRDPITRLPVIVISRQAAGRLIPLPPPGEISPGMRLINVRTAAGSTLMPLVRPGRVRLLLDGAWQETSAVLGLSPEGYSGFQALVPSCLITFKQGGMSLCP